AFGNRLDVVNLQHHFGRLATAILASERVALEDLEAQRLGNRLTLAFCHKLNPPWPPSEGNRVLFKLAAVRLTLAVLLVLRPVQEADVLGHDLRHPPPAAVLPGVLAVLQPPLDGHEPPLVQVVGADLRELAPRHDGKEVRLPVALLVGEGPVYGD